MATPESNSGDQNSGRGQWPPLEPRRERPAEVPAFAPEAQPIRPQVPAIYLIEREAIRLRRRRWEELDQRAVDVDRDGSDPLNNYARPPDSGARTPLTQRIGRRVSAFFSKMFKSDP